MKRIGVFISAKGASPEDHLTILNAFAKGAALDPENQVALFDLDAPYVDCDVAVVFGVLKRAVPRSWARGRIWHEHRTTRGRPIVVLERGYVRRDEYYTAGWNGLNGHADHRVNDSHTLPGRWTDLGVELKPLANRKGPIVVCGQVPWDATVQDHDNVAWCQKIITEIGRNANVLFRPHPEVAGKVDHGIDPALVSMNTWEHDLATARAIITFNSTTSSLAVIEGIPFHAANKGSIARELSNPMIDDVVRGVHGYTEESRMRWVAKLAYRQWTEAEMLNGSTWTHLIHRGLDGLSLPFGM